MGGGGGGGAGRSVAGQNTLFVLLLCEHKTLISSYVSEFLYLLMSQNYYIVICLKINKQGS